MSHIVYKIETELETDCRWIAEIIDVPGVLAYRATEKEAIGTVRSLAQTVKAQRDHSSNDPLE